MSSLWEGYNEVIIKCTACHYEWQAMTCKEAGCTEAPHPYLCDWCGAPGERIAADWADNKGEGISELTIEKLRDALKPR